MRTKNLIILAAILLPSLVFSQPPEIIDDPSRQPDIFKDPNRVEPRASSVPDISTAAPMSEQAIIKYGIGNAPFYVNLKSYVYRAESAFRRNSEALKYSESEKLNISTDAFEHLILTLSRYREKEKDDWEDHKRTVCTPYFRDQFIDNEYARAAIAQLDDSDPRRAVFVEEIMQEVEENFDPSLVERLRERINEYGQSVDYEKIDLIKYIDHRDGLSAGDYLKAECDAL